MEVWIDDDIGCLVLWLKRAVEAVSVKADCASLQYTVGSEGSFCAYKLPLTFSIADRVTTSHGGIVQMSH